MQKKILSAVAILIIIIVAGVGFWRWKNVKNADVLQNNQGQVEVEQAQEKTEDIIARDTDTSKWKTYRNEEYGFEVKYPKNWELIVRSSNPNKLEKDDSFIFQKERHIYFAVLTNGGFGYGTLPPKKNTHEKFGGKEAEMSWYENSFPNFVHIISEIPSNWSKDENMIEARVENADESTLNDMKDIYNSFQFIK